MIINKDVVIIGAGPAGMSSALYLSRSKYDFEILESNMVGGKLNITTSIENYPGVGVTDGFSLTMAMKNQLKEKNIKITKDTILDIIKEDQNFKITTKSAIFLTKTIIIATGSTHKKLGIPNEDKFSGKGISYCAVCDGFLYRNKDVAVFANSRNAYLEALYLAPLVRKLYLINDGDTDDIESNLSKLKGLENIEYYPNSNITSFNGEEFLESITINNSKTVNISACFPLFGDVPSSYLFDKLGLEKNKNYLVVNKNMETNIAGIYAAGDVVDKPLRQIVTACSDGAIAATSAIVYLNKLK